MLEHHLKPGHFFIAPDDADFEYLNLSFDMASGDFARLLTESIWTIAPPRQVIPEFCLYQTIPLSSPADEEQMTTYTETFRKDVIVAAQAMSATAVFWRQEPDALHIDRYDQDGQHVCGIYISTTLSLLRRP